MWKALWGFGCLVVTWVLIVATADFFKVPLILIGSAVLIGRMVYLFFQEKGNDVIIMLVTISILVILFLIMGVTKWYLIPLAIGVMVLWRKETAMFSYAGLYLIMLGVLV